MHADTHTHYDSSYNYLQSEHPTESRKSIELQLVIFYFMMCSDSFYLIAVHSYVSCLYILVHISNNIEVKITSIM